MEVTISALFYNALHDPYAAAATEIERVSKPALATENKASLRSRNYSSVYKKVPIS